jgi:prepilin-type N-terminal cleavage/methylation domain-containing protein
MNPAFTMLEMLITIVVVAILIGLAVPALGAARNRAKETRHLSNTRQLLIALGNYSTDYKDRFPAVYRGTGEDTDSFGQPLPNTTVAPQSYLVRNTLQWTDPLYRSGHDLPVEGFFGPPDELNPVRRTHYLLTGAAFAEPALFVDDPQVVPALLRVQAVTRTRHPAGKGYLLVTHSDAWSPDREDLDPVLAGTGDGSASKRSPRAEALADPDGNAIGMPSWPVLWTRHGLEGQDF